MRVLLASGPRSRPPGGDGFRARRVAASPINEWQPLIERMVAALLEHRPPQLVPFVRKWLDVDEVPAALAAVASTRLCAR